MIRRSSYTGAFALFFVWIGVAFTASAREADVAAGSWKFEKSQTYRYPKTPVNPPPFPNILIRDNKVTFSMSCSVAYTRQDYFFSDVFQPLSKSGDTQAQLDRFLTREFSLSLAKATTVLYLPAPARNCAEPVMYMFVTPDRIVIPVGRTLLRVRSENRTEAQPSWARLPSRLLRPCRFFGPDPLP